MSFWVFFLRTLLEAVATLVFMFVPFFIAALYDRHKRLKRKARVKEWRRKRELARHESECQGRLRRQICALEGAKAKQTITIKGYGAAKLTELINLAKKG